MIINSGDGLKTLDAIAAAVDVPAPIRPTLEAFQEADVVTVQVRIPTILRTYTGGAAEVTAAEGTLREVIAGLDAAYPGLGGRILDDAASCAGSSTCTWATRTCVSPRDSTRTCPRENRSRSSRPWLVGRPRPQRR